MIKIFLFLIFFSALSFAQTPQMQMKKHQPQRKSQLHLLVGQEYRPEYETNGDVKDRYLSNLALGYNFKKVLLLAEYASFSNSDSEAVIGIDRKYEDLMLWVDYLPVQWKWLEPFFGAGAGASRTTVKTRFQSLQSESEGRTKVLAGINFGLRINIPYLWLSAEARVMGNDGYNPNSYIGALVRLGVSF